MHIVVICGLNRKFYKQCNSQQLVCDMQFTVVANESNRELRWQGASGWTHPVFVSSWLGVRQTASPQLFIGFFRHRLAPLVGGALAGYFHCQMREPAIGCSTVPVLDLRGNVHHIARMQLLRRFVPFLIVAPACHADKDLSAALYSMVDVPVVPAARLKGDVVNANLCGGQGAR